MCRKNNYHAQTKTFERNGLENRSRADSSLISPDRSRFITTWWRHQIETFSALLAVCAGNSPIHRSPVNSPHKGQWRGALMFSFICVWINRWVNNREAGDLRRYRAYYDVIVIIISGIITVVANRACDCPSYLNLNDISWSNRMTQAYRCMASELWEKHASFLYSARLADGLAWYRTDQHVHETRTRGV